MNFQSWLAKPARLWSSYSGGKSPSLLCLFVAIASVILSCYPIVFFGKSFLSPNNHSGTYLLYGRMPTVPGYSDTTTDEEKGADLGAVFWYSWPSSVVESRALLKYHELPLWNRYDSNGVPLLGQGQSMFGDPLHLLVLLSKGSSLAWDVKYLLAKIVFSFTIGVCVLQITTSLPAALIITASAPFIGFFSYRYAHPAFFSLCYAPLILLCWLKLIDSHRSKRTALWLGSLVLANWTVLNSGTVKEAYILLCAMNLCGLLALLLAREVRGGKLLRLRQAILALALFAAISTPVWFTFLHTLRMSGTAYEARRVYQLQPSLLIGLFDDIFYRQFNSGENHLDPSTNFLVLSALLWLLASRDRRLGLDRMGAAVAIVCIAALLLVFGIVPPALISKTPFLDNILHIDNTFSCVAIVCLLVLAGLGVSAYYRDCHSPKFRGTYFRMTIYFFMLLALYFGTTQAAQRSTTTLLHLGEQVPMSGFFWAYFPILAVTLISTPLLGRFAVLQTERRLWVVFALLLCFVLLHWRNGMHLKTPVDPYVMNPHQRVHLAAKSPVLDAIKTRAQEPVRTGGTDSNFFPGYGGAVGLEQIDGPDPLISKEYRSLMQQADVGLIFGAWRYRIAGDHLERDLPLFDMLNVRYYLSSARAPLRTNSSFAKLASLDLDLYESRRVWPRAFFTNKVIPCGDDRDLVGLLDNGDGTPFAAVRPEDIAGRPELYASSNIPPPVTTQTVPATDYALTANSTSFKVSAPGPGVIVLSETFVPGDFTVRVNNTPVPYFRINSVFKGVFVDNAGSYFVTFTYWPRFFTATLCLSGLATGLLVIWLIATAKFNRATAAPQQATASSSI